MIQLSENYNKMSRKGIYMSVLLGGLLACNPATEGTHKSRSGKEASEIIGKAEPALANDLMKIGRAHV